MDESDEINFCALVGACVEKQYGLEDGDDLCFNLLERGTIPEDASVDEAALIVAQHIQQA
jgi:hypothetical protein